MVVDGKSEVRDSSPVLMPKYRTSCDLCKRMKIKCEKRGDSCVHCIERGSKCETTVVERKKRQVKSNMTLLEMENRIKRLESVIAAAGLDGQLNGDIAEESATDSPGDLTNLSDRLSTLMVDDEGSAKFLGPSSGFSLFSPQGLQWISETTGSNDLSQFISKLSKSTKDKRDPWAHSQEDMWYTMAPSDREPLPSKEIADQYINCFFETFNTVLPLYDKEIFEKHYELQYGGTPVGGPAWYASLNVVIALGATIFYALSRESAVDYAHSKIQAEEDLGSIPDANSANVAGEQHWKYFRNACSCFLDLIFKDCSLMAVQAICGMALIQQMSFQPQIFHVLTATAARLAHGIGLHRKLDDFGLSHSEVIQRRNVFWIVYIIDKTTALRFGHPSVMTDDDIGVDLPDEDTTICYNPDGSRKFNIFRYQVELALLEGRIYTELYSIRSRKRSDLERLKAVGRLDQGLQEWLRSIPVEIRPDEKIQCGQEHIPPVFMMHFAYYNCLGTIHRASIHHRSWTNTGLGEGARGALQDHEINPRVYVSQSICLTAARKTINILQEFDILGNFRRNRFIWLEMYFHLSAFLTLFANTLQNPKDECVRSDLELMDLVISVLSPMMVQTSPLSVTRAIKGFQELGNVARKFVDKANATNTKCMKRAYSNDGPMSEDIKKSSTTSDNGVWTTQSDVVSEVLHYTKLFHQNAFGVQYQPDSQEPLEHQNLEASSISLPLDDNTDFTGMNFDAPLFSDYFEWDLANLWNQDFSQQL